jgi:ribose transport system permease protein
MKKELGIFVLLVLLCAITAIMNPRFLTPENLQNTGRLIGAYGLLGLGLGVVIITGGIDLSVGSVLALLGVLLSMAVRQWGVPGFVAVLLIIADDETKGFGNAAGLERLQSLATGNLLGVPMPFVLLMVVAALMWVLIHRSVYGRYLFAVGNNEDAARYSGINSKRMIASAYIVCAALAGIAAVIFAFYTNSVSPSSHGNFFELYGIAAAVLGGCSLRGGEGSVVGILLGTALLQVLQNLVNLLGIPSSLNFAVMGAVILIGVLADQLLKRRKGKA